MNKKDIDTLTTAEFLELPDKEKIEAGYTKATTPIEKPEDVGLPPEEAYKAIDLFNELYSIEKNTEKYLLNPSASGRNPGEVKALVVQIEEMLNHLSGKYGADIANNIMNFAVMQNLIMQGVIQNYWEAWTKNIDIHCLANPSKDKPLQAELFPVFQVQKTVELKKQFTLNFGGLDRIRKDHKKLLSRKLSSGLTLQQHIDKVEAWFNNLHGETLGNWIKLFAYVKAVKEFAETNEETAAVNFRVVEAGRYCFSIRQNKDFFSYFIRPDKSTRQFTTKAKNKFLKWLHDNQNTIEFPMILNGKVWNVPMRIYTYAESVEDRQIFFYIDTNILESEFKDYVSINISEIDAISETWESLTSANQDFKIYSLNNFLDIPLKFLLTLKNIYSRNGNYKVKDYTGNIQKVSRDNLDTHLGNLSERIQRHLKNRGKIKTGKTSEKPQEIKRLILETTFDIARNRKWLISLPGYDKETGIYTFNINAGYFDRKETARRLKSP